MPDQGRANAGASRRRIRAVFIQLDHAYFPIMAGGLRRWFQGHHSWRDHAPSEQQEGDCCLDLQGSFFAHSLEPMLQGYGRLGVSEGSAVCRWGLGEFQQLSGYAPFQIDGS